MLHFANLERSWRAGGGKLLVYPADGVVSLGEPVEVESPHQAAIT
jgi:hypothetical protein